MASSPTTSTCSKTICGGVMQMQENIEFTEKNIRIYTKLIDF